MSKIALHRRAITQSVERETTAHEMQASIPILASSFPTRWVVISTM